MVVVVVVVAAVAVAAGHDACRGIFERVISCWGRPRRGSFGTSDRGFVMSKSRAIWKGGWWKCFAKYLGPIDAIRG